MPPVPKLMLDSKAALPNMGATTPGDCQAPDICPCD